MFEVNKINEKLKDTQLKMGDLVIVSNNVNKNLDKFYVICDGYGHFYLFEHRGYLIMLQENIPFKFNAYKKFSYGDLLVQTSDVKHYIEDVISTKNIKVVIDE